MSRSKYKLDKEREPFVDDLIELENTIINFESILTIHTI